MTRFRRHLPALPCATAAMSALLVAKAQADVSLYGLVDLSAGQFQTAGTAKSGAWTAAT